MDRIRETQSSTRPKAKHWFLPVLLLIFSQTTAGCTQEASAQSRPRVQWQPPTATPTTVPVVPPTAVQPRAATTATVPATVPATATNAATARVMNLLEEIEHSLRSARYRHDTVVNVREGRYEFDCSGMIAWVLARTAPAAHRATLGTAGGPRPLAADYARHFLRVANDGRAHNGWRRVARVEDARPGDVLAWIKPRIVPSHNTGHIGFVVEPPVRSSTIENGWLVRIADSSSYQHQDDTREGTERTGFGRGTLLITVNPDSGAPVAFGWFGERSSWVLETSIAIARPVR